MNSQPAPASSSTSSAPDTEVARRAQLLKQAGAATRRLSGLFRVEQLAAEPTTAPASVAEVSESQLEMR